MKKHEKGLAMRDDIIKVATRLFYEQGYKNTLFAHITKELDIAKSLITYHFGSKANLAHEVHTSYIIDIHNEIVSHIYSRFDESLKHESIRNMSLLSICTSHMYNNDENARRFYVEHMSDNFQYSIEQTQLGFFLEQRRKYNKGEILDPEYIRMVVFAQRAARASVVLGYFRGKLDLSFEEVMDYSLSINYRMENVSDEETVRSIQQAKEFYYGLGVEFLPYFKIKIK